MVTPDGSSLLTAAQDSDNIKTCTIDQNDGSIEIVDTEDSPNQPTILAIVA